MTETSLGALDAARVVDEARRWDLAIRQRGEGITWMIWGIVTSAIFITYGLAEGRATGWVASLLWIPWVVAGNVVTVSLWHMLALTAPRAFVPDGRHIAGVLALYLPLVVIMIWLEPSSWTIPMVAIGAVWSLLGAVIPGMTREGRWAGALIGVATALAAIGIVLAGLPEDTAATLAAVLVGVIPLFGGVALAMRG